VIGRDPTREDRGTDDKAASRFAPCCRGFSGLPSKWRRGDLRTLSEQGYLLGLTTVSVEAAAHINLARAGLNHDLRLGGLPPQRDRSRRVHEAGVDYVLVSLRAPLPGLAAATVS
jgi:hypothetical protein